VTDFWTCPSCARDWSNYDLARECCNPDAKLRQQITDALPYKFKALQEQIGGDHYRSKAVQPIQFILANGLSFCEGNVVKYVTRWKDKGGLADLKKARHYLDFLIEREESKMCSTPSGTSPSTTEG
jgi:hypothetical protein